MVRFFGAVVLATMILAPALVATATAKDFAATATVSELSAQRDQRPRLRVSPGRLLYRDCSFRLVQEWRPSGTVIVPRQRCWWVRG